jgi:hypothetical protein
VYNSLLTSHAAITANGFYSIKNVIYNRSASTLASLSGTGGPLATVSQFQYINADNINSTQGLTVTGSITVSGSVINNLTASYAISASQALSASYATTASYALNGGVTQLLAGSNVILSPTNGLGQVTISSTGGGGGAGNTATGSYGSFYDTTIQTNVASTARSMSLNTTDITNGVSISGSTNPYNTYIKVANAGVYDIQFSAQVDKTDSGTDEIWIWIRKNGTDISDSATSVQLQGNGAHYVAAWNFFVNAAAGDYFQLMWYSPDVNVRLHAESAFGVVPGIPSLIVTANRVDQFLSNTGSFSGSFTGNLIGTASYATNALSASYAPGGGNPFPYNGNAQISGSLGVTGSFTVQTYDAFISNAFVNAVQITDTNRTLYDIFGNTSIDAGGRILIDNTSNPSLGWLSRTMFDSSPSPSINWGFRYLYNSSGSISLDWETGILTGSLFGTASYTTQALSASYTTQALSASYATQALSASYAPGGGNPFPFNGDAQISGSLGVTGSFSVLNSIDATNKVLIGVGGVPGSTVNSVNWDSRTLFDSNGNFSVRWGNLRSLYDTNVSQSIDWQNRQLKDSNGNENLNWSSGVSITGSLTVSGSLRGQVSALSISSNTASIDMSTNNFFTLALVNGANTHINPTNINPGQTVNIRVTQGTLGTGTVSFPSIVDQPSGSLYTGSAVANAIDIVTMITFDSSIVFVSSVRNMI